MAKTFEDYFTEYQTDMISIAMEYADYREEVETLFVYASCEEGAQTCNYFFKVNGKIVRKSKINEVLHPGVQPFDVSRQRQAMAGRIMMDDFRKIYELCEEYDREMPTEFRIVYNPKTNKVSTDYCYDLVRTKDPNNRKTGAERMDEWMAEEAAKLGQNHTPLF